MNLRQIRSLFRTISRRAGVYPELVIGSAADFPAARDFAFCDGDQVVIAPKLVGQRRRRVTGILLHELAHCVLIRQGREHTERECDRVAELLFGKRIRYDREDVQTTGRGRRPRPAYLPP